MAPTSMLEFARMFRLHFPDMGASNRFLDMALIALGRRPRLDVVALDNALIAKHGEYDGSMADFVTATYGAAAATWVREAL